MSPHVILLISFSSCPPPHLLPLMSPRVLLLIPSFSCFPPHVSLLLMASSSSPPPHLLLLISSSSCLPPPLLILISSINPFHSCYSFLLSPPSHLPTPPLQSGIHKLVTGRTNRETDKLNYHGLIGQKSCVIVQCTGPDIQEQYFSLT